MSPRAKSLTTNLVTWATLLSAFGGTAYGIARAVFVTKEDADITYVRKDAIGPELDKISKTQDTMLKALLHREPQ